MECQTRKRGSFQKFRPGFVCMYCREGSESKKGNRREGRSLNPHSPSFSFSSYLLLLTLTLTPSCYPSPMKVRVHINKFLALVYIHTYITPRILTAQLPRERLFRSEFVRGKVERGAQNPNNQM